MRDALCVMRDAGLLIGYRAHPERAPDMHHVSRITFHDYVSRITFHASRFTHHALYLCSSLSISRCTTRELTPNSFSRRFTASATITDRCRPPVHPTPTDK